MSKKKAKPAVGLFIVLIVLFILGMAAEVILKYTAVPLRTNMPEVPAEVTKNQVLSQFGDEAVPIYAMPALVFSWILIHPHEIWAYALRWLPYLVLFLLPAFAGLARGRGKGAPLLICAAAALYTGLSLVVTATVKNFPGISVWGAVPFLVEFFLLIIGCAGIFGRSRSLAVTAGTVFIILAPVSVFVTAIIASAGMALPGFPLTELVKNAVRDFPISYASSHWPIFKAFAFLMYGLNLVNAVGKKAKKS